MLTGESKAIFKKRGDVLLSGSFINSGNVKTFAYKVGNDTYISQVENKIHSICGAMHRNDGITVWQCCL